MPFVYILLCSDNSFYVGHTDNLSVREEAHNAGTAAQYTARRRPVTLVHSESYDSLSAALSREKQLKRWSAQKKGAMDRIHCSHLQLTGRSICPNS
jgi:predicted GIY-YIG superfamily endonuclease